VWRGHSARKKNKDIIVKINKAKMDFVTNKAARRIQKVTRGHFVRVRLARMHRAAFYI
jgi:hypothetical protein